MPNYTTYTITNSDSSTFTGIGLEDSIEKQYDPREGIQNVVLLAGWAYASGTKPKLTGAIATVAAAGSKIVMQEIPATTSDPRVFRCILLSGSAGATVSLNDDSDSRSLSAGRFVDVVDDSSGAYLGDGGTFAGDDTAGSEGLMTAINAAKLATGVD